MKTEIRGPMTEHSQENVKNYGMTPLGSHTMGLKNLHCKEGVGSVFAAKSYGCKK